ncbi:hypothetical protein ACFSBZ_06580 [Amnibacterium flavum]|uniref:Uncharacterized protein n=1 Tax=Amnibacterium flavum TaxID=2173173 RepID=A0A2V1HUX2_9MICO|nr:hypothetical protein [Amnibacterium flavum]PVZ93884.1 hypothetical protein DDQ50_08910 [Amnibacterium flavum]
MTGRLPGRVLLICAIVLVVVGAGVLIAVATEPVSFGWTAYAPLSETTFTPVVRGLESRNGILGAVLLVIGLMGLAFWAGLRVGARRRSG